MTTRSLPVSSPWTSRPAFAIASLVALALTTAAPGQQAGESLEQAVVGLRRVGAHFERDESRPDRPIVGLDSVGNGGETIEVGPNGAASRAACERDLRAILPRIGRLKTLRALTIPQAVGLTDEGLDHLKGLTELRTLDIELARITDDGLSRLEGLTELRDLDLGQTPITDAGLAHLAGLKELRRLVLYDAPIQGPGLASLKDLPHLETLILASPTLTDEASAQLKDFRALRILMIGGARVLPSGLAQLRELKTLRFLNLATTAIDDRGMAEAGRMTQLEAFACGLGGSITDAGVAHLRSLTGLKSLSLFVEVTDAGLEPLEALTGLETLEITSLSATPAGIARLRKALPKTKVFADVQPDPTGRSRPPDSLSRANFR